MTGTNRMLGLSLVLAALAALPASARPPLPQNDAQDAFKSGVELLQRGRNEEALRAFEQLLNSGLTGEQAYEIFKETESEIWLDMLRQGGDLEQVARRLMTLATEGRKERRSDEAAIKGLLAKVASPDVLERRAAIRTLAAEHGAFAVPYMLPSLADQANEERRVAMITALASMDTDVVLPLSEALSSPDPYLRRNVAYTLGYIRDERAAGLLAWHAQSDPDGAVRQAAGEALKALGASPDALAHFLKAGEDYSLRRPNVLGDHQLGEVVWSWGDGGLAPASVPPDLYGDELAKREYLRALSVDPANLAARAGVARACAAQSARARTLAQAGAELGAVAAEVEAGTVAVYAAGVDAADAALSTCLEQTDLGTAAELARFLGSMSTRPTAGLQSALGSGDAVVRAEAAVALARTGASSPAVVSELGAAAGREIVRIAHVIDADAARAEAIASSLQAQGWMVATASTGARGLAALHRVPGVDAVLVAERLPDLTANQVIADLRAEPRTASTPLFLITGDAEAAGQIYGESVQGLVTSAGDLSALEAAASASLTGGRAQAEEIATRALQALSDLALSGADLLPAQSALLVAVVSQPDPVAIRACEALGRGGSGEAVGVLVAAAADSARSEAVRAAAGYGAARIVGRGKGALSADSAGLLQGIVASDAPNAVRQAAASALGAAQLSAAERASLLQGGRTRLGPPNS